MTQHEKILDMHKDGQWHCGNAYRALYIFSPHKRRGDIEKHNTKATRKELNYEFIDRPCEHDSPNVRDYYLKITPKEPPKPIINTLFQVERKPDYTKI